VHQAPLVVEEGKMASPAAAALREVNGSILC
jgi:hypothetical protein